MKKKEGMRKEEKFGFLNIKFLFICIVWYNKGIVRKKINLKNFLSVIYLWISEKIDETTIYLDGMKREEFKYIRF